MKELHIRARLHCHNHYKAPQLYRIIRGNTATLTYNWTNKSYLPSDLLEQLKFNFKQDSLINSFEMFDYFKKTADTEIVAGKTYYILQNIIEETKKCEAEKVETPIVEDIDKYYEHVEITDGENDLYWSIDRHFELNFDEETGELLVITFTFSPEETLELTPTYPGNEMQFEIEFRFDTDDGDFELVDNKDSIFTEKQAPIIVVDSLESEGE